MEQTDRNNVLWILGHSPVIISMAPTKHLNEVFIMSDNDQLKILLLAPTFYDSFKVSNNAKVIEPLTESELERSSQCYLYQGLWWAHQEQEYLRWLSSEDFEHTVPQFKQKVSARASRIINDARTFCPALHRPRISNSVPLAIITSYHSEILRGSESTL